MIWLNGAGAVRWCDYRDGDADGAVSTSVWHRAVCCYSCRPPPWCVNGLQRSSSGAERGDADIWRVMQLYSVAVSLDSQPLDPADMSAAPACRRGAARRDGRPKWPRDDRASLTDRLGAVQTFHCAARHVYYMSGVTATQSRRIPTVREAGRAHPRRYVP